ncbi:MMPL family transporter [Paenibacillus albiflavus]|uniref:MMPL family transporter n=1 Tax=Paenibacillus albiflavus TaxID=2545760 RepID=A0A4R4EB35_9BACL|nr:MMPL family transporter [Paenibacillus albiflavus]TCZ76140.1 MMPL family transporter [Paenibacillus albiflavus]
MREVSKKGAFWHWGNWMYKLRFIVLVFWVLLLAGSAIFAAKAPGLLKDNGFTPVGSESDNGIKLIQDHLQTSASVMNLVYESDQLDLTESKNQQVILDSLQELAKLPYVEHVEISKATRNPDARSGVESVDVMMNLHTDAALQHYPEIRSKITAPEGMQVYLTGGTAALYDMQEASKNDIVKAEMIGLPLALIVLLLVFGTIVGALLPLVVGLMSVTTTLGIVYFIAQNHSLSNFLPNLVTMLGLAVGIDYALFLTSRFREELRRQSTVREAVAMTCQTAGHSIFFSGIAVLIGLLGMLFIDLNFFQSLSVGGIIVVTISVIVGNTLLLALFAILGHKINSLRVIPSFLRRKKPSQFWNRVATVVMKRPIIFIVVIAGVLIYAMTPITQIKYNLPSTEVLPPSYDSRYGSDVMKQTYDMREVNGLRVAVQAQGNYWEEQTIAAVSKYMDDLKQTTDVRSVQSYLTAFEGRSPAEISAMLSQQPVRDKLEAEKLVKDKFILVAVTPESNPDDAATDTLVKKLRMINPDQLETTVTGSPVYRLDVIDRIQDKLVNVLLFVFGVTFVVLLFAFRSVLLPLKAVLMNVLSLGASLGIVVAVFQFGHLADLFQITSIGYVSAMLPVIIFCVVFGISMDYEVFLISRIQEEYESSWNNEQSTAEGLKKTGSLITSAAFILIVVVGSFIFTDIEIMKAMGLGLGLAVLIDATVVRVLLVPALMKLLGKANWWAPRWMRPSRQPDKAVK